MTGILGINIFDSIKMARIKEIEDLNVKRENASLGKRRDNIGNRNAFLEVLRKASSTSLVN